MSAVIKHSLLVATGVMLSVAASAQTVEGSKVVSDYLGYSNNNIELFTITVGLLMTLLFIMMVYISLGLNKLKRAKAIEEGADPELQSSWWDLFRRTGKEDKFVEGHEYDGIVEYDNSPPAWFNWLFYGTIIWAAAYLLYYHVFSMGDLQIARYEKQMAEAEVIIAKAQESAIKFADEPAYTDEEKLAQGATIYMTNCAMCHGEEGQGNIGPNLTDDYYIHGGTYKDVYTVIFNGVPEKGMLSWKKALKPDEIRAVASYVHSLRGTKPANPKPPQGEKATDGLSADAGVGAGINN